MIGYYNYTVILTYLSLFSSVTGIYFASTGSIDTAVILLMVSGFLDMFDGKVARTKKDRTREEKMFGIQIDSLCDIVCFGVLPACIGIYSGYTSVWQIAVMNVFVLCGLIRLAFFNVSEEIRQDASAENRKEYQGLPITASAIIIPLVMCLRKITGVYEGIIYSLAELVLAFLYIGPIKVRKPGLRGIIIFIITGALILFLFFKSA